jgi:uncharacterized membrane protein AbrB (regulator of aidB expression)
MDSVRSLAPFIAVILIVALLASIIAAYFEADNVEVNQSEGAASSASPGPAAWMRIAGSQFPSL